MNTEKVEKVYKVHIQVILVLFLVYFGAEISDENNQIEQNCPLIIKEK